MRRTWVPRIWAGGECFPREWGEPAKGRSRQQRPGKRRCVSRSWSPCAVGAALCPSVGSQVLQLGCAGFLVLRHVRVHDTLRTPYLPAPRSAIPGRALRLQWLLAGRHPLCSAASAAKALSTASFLSACHPKCQELSPTLGSSRALGGYAQFTKSFTSWIPGWEWGVFMQF